jgi:hypothetical protein
MKLWLRVQPCCAQPLRIFVDRIRWENSPEAKQTTAAARPSPSYL